MTLGTEAAEDAYCMPDGVPADGCGSRYEGSAAKRDTDPSPDWPSLNRDGPEEGAGESFQRRGFGRRASS